jgi:hypothetical protein
MHHKEKRNRSEKKREGHIVKFKSFKVTLSSTVISRFGHSLVNEKCVRIVMVESKLVTSAACSSCEVTLKGDIQPWYYSKQYNSLIRANYFHVFSVQTLKSNI